MAKIQHLTTGFENDHYMSRQQLGYFRNRLMHWRHELSTHIERAGQDQFPGSESTSDWLDKASLQTQAELSRVNCEHSIRIIGEIDEALNRIRLGTYGFCIATGEEIGIKRLIAMPTAKYSIEAQEEMEMRRKNFRPSPLIRRGGTP